MTESEMEQYVKELIQKYDYYDPITDRVEVLKFARIKNKKVLDVGTGKGHIAILAAKKFNCDVTTIDVSEDKIKLAQNNAKKENVIEKINFKFADATTMPFQKKSFDAVISFNALHHSGGHFKKIVAEMFRVTKSKVVITEINENGAKVFDEYLHPEENHKSMALNLDELYGFLKQQSKVVVLERKLMTTFVCENREV